VTAIRKKSPQTLRKWYATKADWIIPLTPQVQRWFVGAPLFALCGEVIGLLCTGVPSVLRLGVEALRATGVAALVGGSPPGSELKVDMLT
jgi:hypothetical protein